MFETLEPFQGDILGKWTLSGILQFLFNLVSPISSDLGGGTDRLSNSICSPIPSSSIKLWF